MCDEKKGLAGTTNPYPPTPTPLGGYASAGEGARLNEAAVTARQMEDRFSRNRAINYSSEGGRPTPYDLENRIARLGEEMQRCHQAGELLRMENPKVADVLEATRLLRLLGYQV